MKELLIYLTGMTVIGFLSMGWDKFLATKDKWRVPERNLILVALFGGSLGSLLGMYVFRHKTRHKLFKFGIPALLAIHLLIFFLYYSSL